MSEAVTKENVTPIKKAPAAKSKLRAVTPKAAEPSKPKILIYGKPGVGKTWALVRGRRNSCLIEFLSDGWRVVTSWNALREAE